MLQTRLRVARRGDERLIFPLVDDGDNVGILEEVSKLVLDIAEIDVHDASPNLVDREHRLDPFDAVRREHADVIAGSDTRGLERVREPVRAFFQLSVRHSPPCVDDREPFRNLVGRKLEEVGEVVVRRRHGG